MSDRRDKAPVGELKEEWRNLLTLVRNIGESPEYRTNLAAVMKDDFIGFYQSAGLQTERRPVHQNYQNEHIVRDGEMLEAIRGGILFAELEICTSVVTRTVTESRQTLSTSEERSADTVISLSVPISYRQHNIHEVYNFRIENNINISKFVPEEYHQLERDIADMRVFINAPSSYFWYIMDDPEYYEETETIAPLKGGEEKKFCSFRSFLEYYFE